MDIDQLDVPVHVREAGGVAFFGIGELRVSASREALKYDDHTKEALSAQLNEVVYAHVRAVIAEAAHLTQWGRRLRFCGLEIFRTVLADLVFAGVFDKNVGLDKLKMPTLRLSPKQIQVSPMTRLVFVDDRRSIRGFDLGICDVVVRRATQATHAEAWQAMRELVEAVCVSGIPVVRTSALSWTRPTTSPRSARTRATAFTFLADHKPPKGGRVTLSKFWEPVERVPEDDDVYVVMDRFCTSFYAKWEADRSIMRTFGITPPVVRGYRSVPGSDNVHPGRTYETWTEGMYDEAVEKDPAVEALVAALPFLDAQSGDVDVSMVVKALGARHPVAELSTKIQAAKATLAPYSYIKLVDAKALALRMGRSDEQADLRAVLDRYPLLDGRLPFLNRSPDDWIEYILGMDLLRATRAETTATTTHKLRSVR